VISSSNGKIETNSDYDATSVRVVTNNNYNNATTVQEGKYELDEKLRRIKVFTGCEILIRILIGVRVSINGGSYGAFSDIDHNAMFYIHLRVVWFMVIDQEVISSWLLQHEHR